MSASIFIVLILLISRSVKSDSETDIFVDTNIRGDIDCSRIEELVPIEVRTAFRSQNGDIYLWLKTAKNKYLLSRVQLPTEGKWFRVYDNYPKSQEIWIKEDFDDWGEQNSVPLATFYFQNSAYLFMNKQKLYFYKYDYEKGKFRHNGLHGAISPLNIEGVLFEAHSFFLVKDRLLRMVYKGKDNATEAFKFYFMDISPPKFGSGVYSNKTGSGHYDSSVHGGFMLFDLDESTIGYSFQDKFSVPLAAVIHEQGISFNTIVRTKQSQAVESGIPKSGFDGSEQPSKLIIPNELWLGCPSTDSCLRFLIDDAVKIAENKLLLFAGRMVFEISSLEIKLLSSQAKYVTDYFEVASIPFYIDTAFTISEGSLFLLKNIDIYELRPYGNSWKLIQKRESFLKNADTAEAIVRLPSTNNLYVFHGQITLGDSVTSIVSEYYIFNYEHISASPQDSGLFPYKFPALSSRRIEDINPRLPAVIDAAFVDPSSNDVILVKNNFFMRISNKKFYKEKDTSDWEYRKYFDCETRTFQRLIDNLVLLDYYIMTKPTPFKTTGVQCEPTGNEDEFSDTLVFSLLFVAFAIIIGLTVVLFYMCLGGSVWRTKSSPRRSEQSQMKPTASRGAEAPKRKISEVDGTKIGSKAIR